MAVMKKTEPAKRGCSCFLDPRRCTRKSEGAVQYITDNYRTNSLEYYDGSFSF